MIPFVFTVWALKHRDLMKKLREHAAQHGYKLSDRFATTPINQAHALADLLNMGF